MQLIKQSLPLILLFLVASGAAVLLWVRTRKRDGGATSALGQYRELSLLSDKGGMAKVYLAFNSETGRYCVLKVLRQELLGDQDVVKKFRREADILKQLRREDANIPTPQVYSSGNISTVFLDLPFIEMEYILGHVSLGDYLRQNGPLNSNQAARVIYQICRAMETAHRLGVIHRDLKPANVLLADGSIDQVVVIDFGVAKVAGGRSVTAGGYGTAAYMSPEQCRGIAHVGLPSDIYSLGVLWFELLTGEKVFDDENPLVVMRQHQEDDAGSRVRDRLKDASSRMLESMLIREEAQRPSIADISASIPPNVRGIEGYKPSVSSKPTTPRRQPWSQKGLFAAALTTTLAVVLGGALALNMLQPRFQPEVGEYVDVPQGLLSGTVSLFTIPSGARAFYVEGLLGGQRGRQFRGVTPFVQLQLPIGMHRIYLDLPNHEQQTVEVTIEPNANTTLNVTLVPGKGYVTLTGTPPVGTEIRLDDRVVSGATLVNLPIPVGSHALIFSSDSHLNQTVPFIVEQVGQYLNIEVPSFEHRIGSLSVNSNLPGVAVSLDGTMRNVTSVTGLLLDELPVGVHTIGLTKEGYSPWSGSVTIREGQTSEVMRNLNPLPGRLTVKANRSARVRAGREGGSLQNRGSTPTVFEVPPGQIRIVVEVPSYSEWETTVDIASGEEKTIMHDFPAPGTLLINSTTVYGIVKVNGVERGATPQVITGLAPGSYTVEVTREMYTPIRRTVTVRSGQETAVIVELQ